MVIESLIILNPNRAMKSCSVDDANYSELSVEESSEKLPMTIRAWGMW
jgi:hypothetical protein